MKDWKWASVRGWPDLMMAAKSHSINSIRTTSVSSRPASKQYVYRVCTLIEICLVETVGPGYVHIIQTGDIAVSPKVLQELDLTQSALG